MYFIEILLVCAKTVLLSGSRSLEFSVWAFVLISLLRMMAILFIVFPRGELLTLRDIERLHKKPKADKETRLATAMVNKL